MDNLSLREVDLSAKDKTTDVDETSVSLFKIARNRMFSAVNAYYIWKHLNMMINTNNDGIDVAEKNVAVINNYSYFFNQIFPSTYKSFVIDLAIFFDSGDLDGFSIKRLISAIKDKLSETQLLDLRKEINTIKSKHGVKISFIQELRNFDVAHQEIATQSRVINYADMEELFSAVHEILNLISKYYDDSITVWDHLETWIANDIEHVFRNLERGEVVRLAEIKKSLT